MSEKEEKTVLDPEDQELVDALTELTPEDHAQFIREFSEQTCEALKKKYGQDFEVFLLGDMFPSRIARMFIHPAGEPEKVFTAMVTMGGEIRDDYPISGHLHALEKEMEASFAGAGIPCRVNAVLPTGEIMEGDAPSLAAFLQEHGMDRLLCRVIFPEGTKAVGIIPALETACGKSPVSVAVNGFILPAEGYEKCAANFSRYPSSSEALIARFSPVLTFFTFVKDGRSSMTTEELLLRMGG